MAVRNPVVRGSRNFKGYFPSKKLSTQIKFESVLELDFFKLFEKSKLVEAYAEQPETIRYTDVVGKLRSYTPDASITLVNKVELVTEIKPFELMLYGVNKNKYAAIARHFNHLGREFIVLTEEFNDLDKLNELLSSFMNIGFSGDIQP